MNEKELRSEVVKNPNDALMHYFLGKELFLKRVMDIGSIKEIEKLFRRAIELDGNLWAPKIMLGELLFKLEKYKGAEIQFREALKIMPNAVSARDYLVRCIELKEKSDRFKKLRGLKRKSDRDILYLFENRVRKFIKRVLKENLGDDWWRKGIPAKLRAKCAARREEGLDEEMDAELLLFADFYDYKGILEYNKKIFASCLNVKEWCKKLQEVEPIRNAIAHNRELPRAAREVRELWRAFEGNEERAAARRVG